MLSVVLFVCTVLFCEWKFEYVLQERKTKVASQSSGLDLQVSMAYSVPIILYTTSTRHAP